MPVAEVATLQGVSKSLPDSGFDMLEAGWTLAGGLAMVVSHCSRVTAG
ncbi:MAG: hypothetical protein WD733_19730 [Bryobacterales bacterium]